MIKLQSGDIWGGISASVVILPLAMAFGVALYSQFTDDVAAGALAGLMTAASLCVLAGLAHGTRGMVSGPTGPTLVLMSGTTLSLSQAGFQGDTLISMLVMLLLLTGIFQALIGLSNGGKLIKYIPYPVVAGFMTGSAVSMVISQMKTAAGISSSETFIM